LTDWGHCSECRFPSPQTVLKTTCQQSLLRADHERPPPSLSTKVCFPPSTAPKRPFRYRPVCAHYGHSAREMIIPKAVIHHAAARSVPASDDQAQTALARQRRK
jgi:hypothetical protein